MLIKMTRDSVCAGDDVSAPNAEMREFPTDMQKDHLLEAVCRGYVDLHYPQQTWICEWNGRKIALFSKDERLVHWDRMVIGDTNEVHFHYVWDRDRLQKSRLMDELRRDTASPD